MNGTELDAAIEQANRIFSRQYRPGDGAQRKGEPRSSEPKTTDWPTESLDAERRFGQPHARLFPFIGRKVRTSAGVGTLLQVFAERVTVVLDSELSRCAFFRPAEIEPISWEL
jgi:hypothetical protein